jgi:hypothetical protein
MSLANGIGLYRSRPLRIREHCPGAKVIGFAAPDRPTDAIFNDDIAMCIEAGFPACKHLTALGPEAYFRNPNVDLVPNYKYVQTCLGMSPNVIPFVNYRWLEPAAQRVDLNDPVQKAAAEARAGQRIPVEEILWPHLKMLFSLTDDRYGRKIDAVCFWHADSYNQIATAAKDQISLCQEIEQLKDAYL